MGNSKRRSKLTESEKTFVVQLLACFDTPSEVAAALRDEFGKELRPQSVEAYDPTKRAGRKLSAGWCTLFERTRQTYLEEIETHVPEANKAVRVRHLTDAARAFKARGNYRGMADMLERIAKEMGNVHSNRREISGRDGRPIGTDYDQMTTAQLNARLAELLQPLGVSVVGASNEDEDSGNVH